MTKSRTWRSNLKLRAPDAEPALGGQLRQLRLALGLAERLCHQLYDTLFDVIDPIERLRGVNLQADYWRWTLERLGRDVQGFAPPSPDFEEEVEAARDALERITVVGGQPPPAA